MANGVVRMIMEVSGLARVRAAFRGVVDEARRADREMGASAEMAARRRARAITDGTRAEETTSRERIRRERGADTEIERSRRRLANADRARLREEERSLRASANARSRMMALAAFGGAAAGVGRAALGRVEGYAGAIGIPNRDALIGSFIDNEQRVIRLGMAGGRDPGELSTRVNEISRSTNTDPTAIISALEVAQNRFSRLGDFADNMEEISRAANAAGGAEALPDWVAAIGEFQRQLGTSSEDIPALLGSMVDAMDAGSIEAGDVAANFAEVMGQFRTMRGDAGSGMGGATEFLASAEALGAGGTGPEEARTRFHAMMTAMSNSGVRRRMERVLGRDTFDDSGRLSLSMGDLAGRMADHSDVFATPAGLETVFGRGNTRALAGFDQITQLELAARANPDSTERGRTVSELMEMSSERGNARIDNTMTALMDSTSGRAIGARITAQTNFSENGEQVVEFMTRLGGELSNLTTTMPGTTEALGALSEVAWGLVGAMGAMNLATGGALFGGAGAALGVGGGAAAGGTAGGGLLGALGTFAMGVVAPVAAAAGVTLYANEAGDGMENFAGTSAGSVINSEAAALPDDASRDEFYSRLHSEAAASAGGVLLNLSPSTIRELASSIGRETGRSVAGGAPADGRSPGEPGRR